MAHAADPHAPATAPAPATEPAAPAPHVVSIARTTYWLGLGLAAAGLLAAAWYLLFRDGWVGFGVAAAVGLYGLCVWLAARDVVGPDAR